MATHRSRKSNPRQAKTTLSTTSPVLRVLVALKEVTDKITSLSKDASPDTVVEIAKLLVIAKMLAYITKILF